MPSRNPSDQIRFGALLREYRVRRGITLTELGERCGIDSGNLSRVERGGRRPPKMPVLLELLKTLGISKDGVEWRAFLSAAARGRLEILADPSGIAYLHYENPLRGLTDQSKQAPTYTVTEAASELGRVQALLGIKKITVEASDGSQLVFQIGEDPPQPGRTGRGKKA